jgi:hypothetical protein
MKELKITLTIDETNKVLEALSLLPFGQVYQLISKIHDGASLQVQGASVNTVEEVQSSMKTVSNG